MEEPEQNCNTVKARENLFKIGESAGVSGSVYESKGATRSEWYVALGCGSSGGVFATLIGIG